MILIEPAMISKNLLAHGLGIQKGVTQLIRSSGSRRDIWPSHAEAKSWMKQRSPWKLWDQRVLDVHVVSLLLIGCFGDSDVLTLAPQKFGMRPLPTRIYPDIQSGVTLSFPRLTHSLAYNNLQDQHDAIDQLKVICLTRCKVYAIFGNRIDYK